jgi:hypothetical protein
MMPVAYTHDGEINVQLMGGGKSYPHFAEM